MTEQWKQEMASAAEGIVRILREAEEAWDRGDPSMFGAPDRAWMDRCLAQAEALHEMLASWK